MGQMHKNYTTSNNKPTDLAADFESSYHGLLKLIALTLFEFYKSTHEVFVSPLKMGDIQPTW